MSEAFPPSCTPIRTPGENHSAQVAGVSDCFLVTSHSSVTALNVLAAALRAAWLRALGSMPSATSLRVSSRFSRAPFSGTSEYAPRASSFVEGLMVPGIGVEGGMQMPQQPAFRDSRALRYPCSYPTDACAGQGAARHGHRPRRAAHHIPTLCGGPNMAAAKNTRARKAHSAPHRPKPGPVPPESPARILSAVRLRLKFVMAAAFTVCAALKFQNAELDEDIALIVGRCVGD